MLNNFVRILGVFLLLLGFVLWGQLRSGAYADEFGGHPDEAAHFVSALMVRDYIAQLGVENSIVHPKDFAEAYYESYPKVAIGNWPPGFHLLQAIWMLVLEPGQGSIFLLMAFLTAGLGTATFLAARSSLGRPWALAACMLLVVFPVVQKYSSLVMTEILLGLLVFCAVSFYARFLDTKHWSWSLGFGLFASMAILVKGSAFSLALIPPLAVVFLRRWHLLKKFVFWLPAIVVGLLCAPWYVFTLEVATDGWAGDSPSFEFFVEAFFYNLKKLLESGGPIILLLAFFGLARTCLARKNSEIERAEPSAFFSLLGILFLIVPLFHCIVPAGMEHRHLIPMLPSFAIFTVVGVRELCQKLEKNGSVLSGRRLCWVICGLALAGMFLVASPSYHKGYSGFRSVVEELYKVEDWPGPVLISSDSSGEGMFVAESALADSDRPSKTVVRATKLLAESKWSGGNYKASYADTDGLRRLLVNERFWAIVIDGAVKKARPDNYSRFRHMKDLEDVCRELQLAERFTIFRGNTEYEGDIVLYRNPKFQFPEKTDFSKLEGSASKEED